MQVGCEVSGEPAPHVSWATPSRGEIMANHTILGLQTVTRADAGQLWWRVLQKIAQIPITTQNGAGVQVATVLTVWMIPKKQRLEGHSIRTVILYPVTRVDTGPQSLTENDAAYTKCRIFYQSVFLISYNLFRYATFSVKRVLWRSEKVYFQLRCCALFVSCVVIYKSIYICNLIAPQVATLALLTMERVCLPRPQSCWRFNVSRIWNKMKYFSLPPS